MTTTQRHEIRAWLGDDWTDEQVEQIITEYRAVEHLADGHPEEREAILTAIAQRIDGTLDRVELVETDVTARIRANHTRTMLRGALRAEVAAGMSEHEAARLYGVTRMTIRAWLGK